MNICPNEMFKNAATIQKLREPQFALLLKGLRRALSELCDYFANVSFGNVNKDDQRAVGGKWKRISVCDACSGSSSISRFLQPVKRMSMHFSLKECVAGGGDTARARETDEKLVRRSGN